MLSPLGFSLSCRLVFLQRRKVEAAETSSAVLEAMEGVFEDHTLRVWRSGLLLFLVEVLEGVLSHQRTPKTSSPSKVNPYGFPRRFSLNPVPWEFNSVLSKNQLKMLIFEVQNDRVFTFLASSTNQRFKHLPIGFF